MAKTNNLKDYLTDLYEGISSKKPNASRNPQDFRSEIESISGGGGATIKSGGGTQYKTNEYVEKLYFNTSLSTEEVDNYLSQLEYADGMYNLFVDDIQVIGVMDASAMGINGYIIMSNYNDGSNLTLIYCSNSTLAQQMGENFEGWNTTFEGVLELNSTSYEVSPNNELPVNPSNITSDLISTTPFGQGETIELTGEYDGSTIEVTDLSGGWQGTVVPNTDYVENVYFNTELSVEEVVGILNTYKTSEVNGIYCFIINDDVSFGIIAIYDNPYDAIPNTNLWRISGIINGEQTILFNEVASADDGVDFVGWNPNITYPLTANINAVEVDSVGMLGQFGIDKAGLDNDKLTSLFSTTPFTRTEENTINIKKYIDEKKIPLSIKVNVEGAGGGSVDYPSEAIAYYKQTRNKDYPYFPLPYEMEEETQDTIYMLYDATGYMCCPVFNVTFTDCVCTIQKYNNTTLINESNVTLTSGSTNYLQFSEEDSDYSTYNYIVIKLQGNITKHYLNYKPKFNGVEYNSSSSSELIEVSGNCVGCDIKVVNSSSYKFYQNLEYYSFLGVSTTSMSSMFNSCYSLQTIPQLDTSNVTNMNSMFNSCSSLQTIPLLDTSNVTNMSYMFNSCYSLQTIPLLDTSNVTNMNTMFNSCYSLQTIPLLDTSKVTNMSYMFSSCYSLQTIPLLDTSNVTNMNTMFNSCYILCKLDITNIKVSFYLSSSTMLSQSELVKVLNNLATVETTQTLTLGSTNLAKLTDDEKAIATGKGWTLA